jgi:hypothetical protein
MFKLADGRERLYQWDSNIKVILDKSLDDVTEVHFNSRYCKGSYTVEVVKSDDGNYAMIPNILLQKSCDVVVYAVCCTGEGQFTKHQTVFEMEGRPKPSGYVYEETEVLTFKKVLKQTEEYANRAEDAMVEAEKFAKKAEDASDGKGVDVDDELSEESENPVQNKVLTKEVIALKEHNAKLKETIEKLQIKVTTEKASFHNIKDSANMKVLDFGLEGKTEQDVTNAEGINLINLPEETVTWSGQPIVARQYKISELCPMIKVGDVVTFSTKSGDNLIYFGGYAIEDGDPWTVNSFMISNNLIGLYGKSGVSEDNPLVITEIMINKGTEKKPYASYVEPSALPTPDHSTEIVNAGVYNEATGRYEHRFYVGNKNWFDLKAENVTLMTTKTPIENIENGIRLTYTNVSDCYVRLNFKLLPNTTYTLRCNTKVESNNSNQFIAINITNGKWYNSVQSIAHANSTESNPIVKFTTPNTTEDIYVYLAGNALYSNITGVTEFTDFILSVDGLTDFTEHQSQQFTLTSPVPLTKWDYLTKRDGVWGWSVNTHHMICVGAEGEPWIIMTNSNDVRTIFRLTYYPTGTLPNRAAGKDTVYCSHYRQYITVNIWNDANLFNAVSGTNGTGSIYFNVSPEFTTLDEWTAWLAENPITVLYQTELEQAFHPLPDEEQELLNNLETYYGVTNLYNDQGCPTWLTYVADPKLYTDKKIAEQIAQTQALILEN